MIDSHPKLEGYRLTPHNFDTGGLRKSLRFQHGFEHDDIERARGVILKIVEHVEDRNKASAGSGMGVRHLDIAKKYIHENPEGKALWKELPELQRPHVLDALQDHFSGSSKEIEKEETV